MDSQNISCDLGTAYFIFLKSFKLGILECCMSKKVEHVLVSRLGFSYFKLMGSFYENVLLPVQQHCLFFSAAFFSLATSICGEGNGTPLQYSCLENPWTEEPGRLQTTGSQRVGHDWATSLSLFPFMHWRRKWQPAPVFLPGESQGRGSLVGCRLWGHRESDTTEAT